MSRAVPLSRLISLGMKEDAHVLDIGCGSGIHAITLASWLSDGVAVGVERDFSLLLEAKARIKKSGLDNVYAHQGDAERLSFEDSSFDYVYSRLVFQHLCDPLKVLKEIRRVLADGGQCLVEDIDRGWFMSWPESDELKQIWHRIEAGQIKAEGDPFIGRKLELLFRLAGFSQIRLSIECVKLDGSDIRAFVYDTGESLLEYVPESRRESDRGFLRGWAEDAAANPDMHSLYMAWFVVSGTA